MKGARLGKLPKNARQAAGVAEVLFKIFSGGLNIDEAWQVRTQPVTIIETERNTHAAAMAIKWITALVDPPIPALTRMAFSKA